MTAVVVPVLARKIEGGTKSERSGRRIPGSDRGLVESGQISMSYPTNSCLHHRRTVRDEAKPPKAAWVERKVVCAKGLLRLCERIKRIDEGLPLLELAKD